MNLIFSQLWFKNVEMETTFSTITKSKYTLIFQASLNKSSHVHYYFISPQIFCNIVNMVIQSCQHKAIGKEAFFSHMIFETKSNYGILGKRISIIRQKDIASWLYHLICTKYFSNMWKKECIFSHFSPISSLKLLSQFSNW